MFTNLHRYLIAARQHSVQLGMILTGLTMALVITVETRWERIRASGDRGSESVEKAVLVAIGLAVAIGLGFAIRAAVQSYQGQIK